MGSGLVGAGLVEVGFLGSSLAFAERLQVTLARSYQCQAKRMLGRLSCSS